MRVRIHDLEIFESGDTEAYHQLRRLFLRAAQGQHELDVSDPEQVLASDFWRVACAGMDSVEWEELLSRTLGGPVFAPMDEPRHAIVSSRRMEKLGGPTAYALLPDEVGVWAEQPLRILLENARDAVLVRLAIRICNSDKGREALERGWLRPEGRGGSGEVKNALQQAAPTDRFFVIIDSDREEPEGPASRTAQDICRLCEGKIHVHVLGRRELENYVPEAIWQLVVVPQPRGKRGRVRGVDHRAVLVYRWLLRLLEQEQEAAAARYGRDALERVVSSLQRQAGMPLPDRLVHELLEEWKALEEKARRVDDLKVRFGRGLADKALGKLDDENFDLNWMDAEATEELRELARKLEEWL
jgi:hypothetical protein